MAAVLQLPRRLARWVPHVPGIKTIPGPEGLLRLGKHAWELDVIEAPAMKLEGFGRWATRRADGRKRRLPLVVGSYLSSTVRADLEKHGVSYADSHGHFHLVGPDLLIHLERRPEAGRDPSVGIGVDGVRVVQLLLEDVEHHWSVTELAKAGAVSAGQAHRILAALEGVGLLAAEGAGPRKKRRVASAGELLDWLARQPSSTRKSRKIEVALYGRTPADLWRNASTALGKHGIAHALTGAAAAALYETGPSAVPKSALRIDPDQPLESVAGLLGAEITTRGSNLVLVRDVGRVGTFSARERSGVKVAPQVRVYLDTFAEKRGEDIAREFREKILGV